MWVSACQSSIQSRIPKLTISINWCSNQMKWFWRMKIPQNLILQGRNALKVPPHQQPQSSMYKNEARGKETAATYKTREIHIRTWAGPSPFHSLRRRWAPIHLLRKAQSCRAWTWSMSVCGIQLAYILTADPRLTASSLISNGRNGQLEAQLITELSNIHENHAGVAQRFPLVVLLRELPK